MYPPWRQFWCIMSIFKLKSNFKPSGDQPKAIEKLIEGVEKGHQYQTLLGVTGSGKTFTIANVISHFDRPVLVMAPNKTLAAQLYREYKTFFPHNSVNYFVSYYDYYQPEAYMPITDTYIEKEAMINEEIDRLRHQATSALLTRRDVIVVASVSCIYNLGIPAMYAKKVISLEIGKPITRQDLISQLVKLQYQRTNNLLKRGFFRVRGDVFELQLIGGEDEFRIEIKDQKVSAIFIIDHLKRTIKEKLKEVAIFPTKHFVSNEPEIRAAVKEIKSELKERLAFFKKKGLYLEAERLERRTKYDIELLLTLGFCHGVENYSRHLTGKVVGEQPETLLSYFPKKKVSVNQRSSQRQSASSRRESAVGQGDFLTIMDESHIGVPQVRGMYEGDKARKEILIQYGWRLPSALDNRPLKFNEFIERIGQTIFTSATPGKWELEKSSQIVEQVIRPTGLIDPPIEVRPVFTLFGYSQTDDFIIESKKIIANGGRVIANVLTKKMAEDLTEFLNKEKLKVNYLHSDVETLKRTEILTSFRRGEFDILVGVNLLREGLDLPEVSLVAIMDADREGFLRSEQSLIQTMGRASRNVTGKVILYADTITESMRKAINEVERRRKLQSEYNKKHGITPTTIVKKIERMLDLEN